jgi:hypothetical protein
MPQLVRHLSWAFAIALVASGCSTFGVTDANLENIGDDLLEPAESERARPEFARRGPANQPASVSDDAEPALDASASDETTPITVRATDQTADLTHRKANAPTAPLHRSVQTSRLPQATDPTSAPSEDQSAAFDQLMAEARRRGALTAADESSFRRDLADVPTHLRPQMAAMLLAMRQRTDAPAESTASEIAAPLSTQIAPPTLTSVSPQHPTTTADRLAQIAPRPSSESLEENPLRALAGIAATKQAATAEGSPISTSPPSTSPRRAASNASNVPGEIGIRQPKTPSGPAWPKTSVPPNAQAPHEAATGATNEEWQVMLSATIHALESKVAANPADPENARRQALLRLLYLTANRLDDTAKVMPADASEQQFWIDWLYGTSVYLDAAATPNDGQRAAIAAERLRDAVQRLGEQANLVVNNLTFCRRVTSFGVYEPFTAKPGATEPHFEFTANQEVLLYAEVRNYTSVPTAKGHHTLLRPSYQIFDSQGRRLGAVVELDESHDYCQRPRTDFFVCYHIYLPTRIDPGAYKLKLTIEDVHGSKVQENSIDFTIKRG